MGNEAEICLAMDSTVRATERREGKTSPVVTVKHVRQPAGRVCLSLVRLAADVRFPNKVVNYCFKLLLFISFGGNTQRSTGKLSQECIQNTCAALQIPNCCSGGLCMDCCSAVFAHFCSDYKFSSVLNACC